MPALVRAVLIGALAATTVRHDADASAVVRRAAQEVARPAAFAVGEKLTYDVKFSAVKVGSGYMQVMGTETIRGTPALHVRFEVKGGTFFYRVHDILESWIDTSRFRSLRHHQDYEEGSRDRERWFELFPERRTYQERGKDEVPSVADPLDEGSFFYFVRTIPLEVGRTYEFDRYFIPDRNPVRITVVRKERIRVPAGTFDAIVVRPVFKSRGLFAQGGKAELWLSDDSSRVLLQMKSSLPVGSLNLYLRDWRPSAGAAPIRGR